MNDSHIVLNQSEWYIMQKLWEQSPRTIMQIYHALEDETGWSKSTVNTLLARMTDKKIIKYEEGDKAKMYYPLIKREDAAVAETTSLLERVYQGSVSMMVNTLVRKNALSRQDIEELQELLKRAGEGDK